MPKKKRKFIIWIGSLVLGIIILLSISLIFWFYVNRSIDKIELQNKLSSFCEEKNVVKRIHIIEEVKNDIEGYSIYMKEKPFAIDKSLIKINRELFQGKDVKCFSIEKINEKSKSIYLK